MQYNKFIFLYTSNFCARINDFFCVEEWIANGYDVEYWDLSAFTCHEHLSDYKIDGIVIREVSSPKEFEILVKKYRTYEPLYMTWVNYCWYSASFYEILSRYNCDYAYLDNALLPPRKRKELSIGELKNIAKNSLNIIRNRYYGLRLKSHKLKPANYYFRISENFDSGADKINDATIVGWVNSGDYERNGKLKDSVGKGYIVFLDQFIPYHNDFTITGQHQVDPVQYYGSLNRCFAILEKKYGIPVVIAAHPAATRYLEENPFNHRDIYFNQTAELVKYSNYVLAHTTNAISYVVLNRKSMLLFTSDCFDALRPNKNDYIKQLSELFGVKYVNQDSACSEDLVFLSPDEKKYVDYKYRYLTNHHSENVTNFESIINVIK